MNPRTEAARTFYFSLPRPLSASPPYYYATSRLLPFLVSLIILLTNSPFLLNIFYIIHYSIEKTHINSEDKQPLKLYATVVA